VLVTEATRHIGGRVAKESRLPGLAAWIRVLDYREQALSEMKNVEIFRESPMSAQDIAEFGLEHVAVATGAAWRRDGVARWHTHPIEIEPAAQTLTPDDLMAGLRPRGRRVVLFDDDHFYLGGVLAELLAREGFDVHVVTPAAQASAWTVNTMEVVKIQRRLLQAGVTLHASHAVTAVRADHVALVNAYTDQPSTLAADSVVLVTARLPHDALYEDLVALVGTGPVKTVRGIGDAWAPGTIAAAVWSGRRYAEEFDATLAPGDHVPFRREVTALAAQP
jgi:dimethylamine/trimethylamine dehydrogenase